MRNGFYLHHLNKFLVLLNTKDSVLVIRDRRVGYCKWYSCGLLQLKIMKGNFREYFRQNGFKLPVAYSN